MAAGRIIQSEGNAMIPIRRGQPNNYLPFTSFVPGFDHCLTITVSVDGKPARHSDASSPETNIMIKSTRLLRSSLLACLFCGASVSSILAQSPADQPPVSGHHHGPPSNVLFDALDANHDGVLSAEEIANAPAVLKGLLKGGETQLTRADLRPENKDGQTPPQRSEREDGRLHHQPPGDGQAADRGAALSSSTTTSDPMDHPHDHRRFSMDDQGMQLPWKHHFQHDGYGQARQRLARAQHGDERAEGHQHPQSDLDGQSDEPQHPHFHSSHRFEAQEDRQDGRDPDREMDQVIATLHKVERELHQLEEKQATPAPTQQ